MAKDPQALSQEELEAVELTERPFWEDGPPHEIFKELRGRCPVHRTERISEYPEEDGFWSLSKAEDVKTVSHDWETYSSERGGVTGLTHACRWSWQQSMFIGMDPPKHDRLKMLFQRGFTPKRIAEHEDRIRAIAERVLDGIADRGAVRAGQRCRAAGRLAGDRQLHGHPGGGRRDLGEADELGTRLRGRGPRPRRPRPGAAAGHPRDLRALPQDDRRAAARTPTDDLTSVLVHAEVDGEKLRSPRS